VTEREKSAKGLSTGTLTE